MNLQQYLCDANMIIYCYAWTELFISEISICFNFQTSSNAQAGDRTLRWTEKHASGSDYQLAGR